MANQTILIKELEETTSVKDSDILIIEDENTTYKIKAKDLSTYISEAVKNICVEIADKGIPNGVAPLNENGKIDKSYIAFGKTSGTSYEGSEGLALENLVTDHINGNTNHLSEENKEQLTFSYTHAKSPHARTDATKTTKSETTGNLKINDEDTNIYTHPQSEVNMGTYKVVTVDSQGHVIKGANPTTLDEFGITDAAQKDHTHESDDITSLDASKLTGKIELERLPHGALERCVVVEDDAARLALTVQDVQKGDTVKVKENGLMYFVIDDSKLNEKGGYEIYTSGTATSVPWTGITDKPNTFPPSEHTHTAYESAFSELKEYVENTSTSLDNRITQLESTENSSYNTLLYQLTYSPETSNVTIDGSATAKIYSNGEVKIYFTIHSFIFTNLITSNYFVALPSQLLEKINELFPDEANKIKKIVPNNSGMLIALKYDGTSKDFAFVTFRIDESEPNSVYLYFSGSNRSDNGFVHNYKYPTVCSTFCINYLIHYADS